MSVLASIAFMDSMMNVSKYYNLLLMEKWGNSLIFHFKRVASIQSF